MYAFLYLIQCGDYHHDPKTDRTPCPNTHVPMEQGTDYDVVNSGHSGGKRLPLVTHTFLKASHTHLLLPIPVC